VSSVLTVKLDATVEADWRAIKAGGETGPVQAQLSHWPWVELAKSGVGIGSSVSDCTGSICLTLGGT
jgi:hypothetical protein